MTAEIIPFAPRKPREPRRLEFSWKAGPLVGALLGVLDDAQSLDDARRIAREALHAQMPAWVFAPRVVPLASRREADE